jgi:glycosyltransferase involved in cell wall biosynthesis
MIIWHYTALKPNSLGGVEKFLYHQTLALKNIGVEYHFGTLPPGNIKNRTIVLHTNGDLFVNPTEFWKLKKDYKLKIVPILHGTSAGRLLACKEFLNPRTILGTLRDFIPTMFADNCIAVSERASFEAKQFFKFKNKIFVVQNGADTSVFTPLERVSKQKNILFLGRATDSVKNISVLINAFLLTKQIHKDAKLFLAPGDSQFAERDADIYSIGPQTHLQVRDLFNNIRVLALTSKYEGNPLVLHEAKSCGLPIFCSDIPAHRELLKNYKNVFFFNPDSALSGFKVLDQIFSLSDILPISEPRDWSEVGNEYLEVYKKLF